MKSSDTHPVGDNRHSAPLSSPRREDPGTPFPVEVRMTPRWQWAAISVFLALIVLPGVWREVSSDSVRGSLADVFRPGSLTVVQRLRAVEKRVDDGVWIRPIRERMQTWMYRVFREGNRKVLVGRDGWLFHRPGMQALTGRGPVLGPTHSVSKDPTLREWEGAIPVIRHFAGQLKERGIRLILVPVPDKAALWSAHLPTTNHDGGSPRLRHPDWGDMIHALGPDIQVVDIDQRLPYLRDDTHWEPGGARAAATHVAGAVLGSTVALPVAVKNFTLSDHGDLVTSLGLGASASHRPKSLVPSPIAAAIQSDASAPIVLLGDSNVAMYDDPGLPFHQPGVGFASWMAAGLGTPIQVIAINGGGATQVRQRFASLPDDVVRAKKTVIWVIAERDLFMDPAVARANGVEWKHVVFNPGTTLPAVPATPGDALVVEATLRAKSEVFDMHSVNYPDAVFVADFTVDRVLSGTYGESELAVVLWNFRNRVVQPTARLAPGQRVRLTLVPWLDQGDLTKTNLQDDFNRFDLTLLYAEKAEVIGK